VTYLVDVNVLSEPTKPLSDPAVTSWLDRHAPEVVVDPIILGEIREPKKPYGLRVKLASFLKPPCGPDSQDKNHWKQKCRKGLGRYKRSALGTWAIRIVLSIRLTRRL
jgi:hypothetical protein